MANSWTRGKSEVYLLGQPKELPETKLPTCSDVIRLYYLREHEYKNNHDNKCLYGDDLKKTISCPTDSNFVLKCTGKLKIINKMEFDYNRAFESKD